MQVLIAGESLEQHMELMIARIRKVAAEDQNRYLRCVYVHM